MEKYKNKRSNNNCTIPFTYLIGWSKLNKYYYGVKYAKGCQPSDLWTKYFTSSKLVIDYANKYGNPDIIQIRKIFNDAQLATQWEQIVLRRLKVVSSPSWLNLAIGNGYNQSPTNTLISKAQLLRFDSQEERDKVSKFHKNKVTCFDIIEQCCIKIPKHLFDLEKGIRYFGLNTKTAKEFSNSTYGFSKESIEKRNNTNCEIPLDVKLKRNNARRNIVSCLDVIENKFVKIPKNLFDAEKNTRYFGMRSKVAITFNNKPLTKETLNKISLKAKGGVNCFDAIEKKYVRITTDEYHRLKRIRYFMKSQIDMIINN